MIFLQRRVARACAAAIAASQLSLDRHKSEAANMTRLAAVDKRIADIDKRLAAEFPTTKERTASQRPTAPLAAA